MDSAAVEILSTRRRGIATRDPEFTVAWLRVDDHKGRIGSQSDVESMRWRVYTDENRRIGPTLRIKPVENEIHFGYG